MTDDRKGDFDQPIKKTKTSAETKGNSASMSGGGFVLGDSGPVRKGNPPVPPPVDFASFVLGLGQTTLVHLGCLPDPVGGATGKDLAQASYTIDLLDLLAEKTQGNLSVEEAQLLGNLRRELKLKYVQAH